MNKRRNLWLIVAIIAVVGFVFVSCGEEEVPLYESFYGTWYDNEWGEQVTFSESTLEYKIDDNGTLKTLYKLLINEYTPAEASLVGYDLFVVTGILNSKNTSIADIDKLVPPKLEDDGKAAKDGDACYDVWGVHTSGNSVVLLDDKFAIFGMFEKTKSSSNININASSRSARR
jgi:hypothetical protein